MLQSMFHTALHVAGSPYAALLIQAVITLGFFGLFWPGEITWSPHTIQYWDVKVSPQQVVIILHSAKCQKIGLPCKINLLAHPYVICPVKALMKYLAYCPRGDGPFFVHQNGRPITRWELANTLDKLSNFQQFPKQLIKPHSLQIGGTTMLYMQGVSTEEIKKHGHWASDYFKKSTCNFAEAQALWLIGDDVLQRAHLDMLTNYDCLCYMAQFKFLETRLSRIMTIHQAIWAFVDLLAANRYIPSVMVLHVGASDFGTLPSHLVAHTAFQMLNTIKHILKKAQPFTHMHLGIFVSHMLPKQWYLSWELQQ